MPPYKKKELVFGDHIKLWREFYSKVDKGVEWDLKYPKNIEKVVKTISEHSKYESSNQRERRLPDATFHRVEFDLKKLKTLGIECPKKAFIKLSSVDPYDNIVVNEGYVYAFLQTTDIAKYFPKHYFQAILHKSNSLFETFTGRIKDRNEYFLLAMEDVNGISLDKWLKSDSFRPVDMFKIIAKVVWIIRKLNILGIRHNDLHPGNIYLIPNGRSIETDLFLEDGTIMTINEIYDIKIIDFDLATIMPGKTLIDKKYHKKRISNSKYSSTGWGCHLISVCETSNEKYDHFKFINQIYHKLSEDSNVKKRTALSELKNMLAKLGVTHTYFEQLFHMFAEKGYASICIVKENNCTSDNVPEKIFPSYIRLVKNIPYVRYYKKIEGSWEQYKDEETIYRCDVKVYSEKMEKLPCDYSFYSTLPNIDVIYKSIPENYPKIVLLRVYENERKIDEYNYFPKKVYKKFYIKIISEKKKGETTYIPQLSSVGANNYFIVYIPEVLKDSLDKEISSIRTENMYQAKSLVDNKVERLYTEYL